MSTTFMVGFVGVSIHTSCTGGHQRHVSVALGEVGGGQVHSQQLVYILTIHLM